MALGFRETNLSPSLCDTWEPHVAQLDKPARPDAAPDIPDGYQDVYDSPEFAELRKRFRRLVIPLVVAFLGWYMLYVLIATYEHGFMKHNVVGNLNVGLFFGLLQFVSTFGIAYLYSLRAEKEIDPLSADLLAKFNHATGGGK